METLPIVQQDIHANIDLPQVNQVSRVDFFTNSDSSSISIDEVAKKTSDLVEKCKKAYQDHCLEEAFRLMCQCEKLLSQFEGETLTTIQAIVEKEQSFFETIKSEESYMHDILRELNTKEGWEIESINGTVNLQYKYIPNTELVTLRLEADIDVPLLNMLTLINEIDLWNHWVPFLKRTSEVKRIHRSAAVYYAELGLPYPLHNREVHLYGYAVNRLYENGSILILAESVDQNEGFLKKHGVEKVKNSGTVNMDIHFAGFEIMPIERNKCRLRGVANINPKFNWVPKSVLNFVIKKGIRFVLDRLITKAKNFKGSVWEKEIAREEKKVFYEWLNQVVEEYYISQKK